VLRTAGAAALGTGVVASTVSAATDAVQEYYDAQPEHVTLSYDADALEAYAPYLSMESQAREKFLGLWGWIARSAEYEHDVYCYVALYSHQEGISPLAGPLSDSHYGDTEWYYSLVDPDTGALADVVFDAYHWIAGKRSASTIPTDGEHPVANVVSPWHMFNHTATADEAFAVDGVADLTAKFPALIENGLDESLEPGTVVNPDRMTLGGRSHWWRDTVDGWSFDAAYARTMYRIGWYGADSANISV
jgi:hypothetical protein